MGFLAVKTIGSDVAGCTPRVAEACTDCPNIHIVTAISIEKKMRNVDFELGWHMAVLVWLLFIEKHLF
jgi:hypothetical protein